MQKNSSKDTVLFRRLLLEARPYWGHISLIFVVSVLATPLASLIPLPLKVVVDSVLGDKPVPGFPAAITPPSLHESSGRILILAALLAVFVSLMRQLQGLANSYLQAYTGEQLVRAFRAKIFRHVQRLSLTYHDARGTADSVHRIQDDARSIQSIAINGVFPDGYATVVGERGMSLSGGERQRISIARAFLKNAPILIPDGPTSALDTETETISMDTMERLMRGRTSLTIAHWLSTVRNCDWRVHFEDGRVQVRRANMQPDDVVLNEALA
jgi:ABC-type multidrug transport system fused ATPase/permease subunit